MAWSTLRFVVLFTAAVVGSAGLSLPLMAQRAQPLEPPVGASARTRSAGVGTPVSLGPRIARAGIDTRSTADAAAPLVAQEGRHLGAGTNLALMGAGAAAVIVGLMIGGDGGTLVAISGGILGLVGLFRYIR